MVDVAVIVAMDENGVIGRNNALPWHLPEDLRHFRRNTLGKPVVMGRKTWDSIGEPLPGRSNIVVSRDASFEAPGAKVVQTLEAALALASNIAEIDGALEVMVIGGAQLYELALPLANRLYLTRVHAQVRGDTVLALDLSSWRVVSEEYHDVSPNNPHPYSFLLYERV